MIIWGLLWIIVSLGICSYGFNQARYTVTEEAITNMAELPNIERLNPLIGIEFKRDADFKNALKA